MTAYLALGTGFFAAALVFGALALRELLDFGPEPPYEDGDDGWADEPQPDDDAPSGSAPEPVADEIVAELRPCDHLSRITITPTNAGRVLERLRIEAIREMHGLDLNAPMIRRRDKQ